ncbi:MAG: peroxiredoxin [Chloroflexi bacterium]|nr:peroxiredoxin [Chloroflexota bacterium]
MPLETGTKAPAFSLKDSDRKDVSLSDYAGKTVVLSFYPAAFSGLCDDQACAFRDSLSELNNANAEVLGISVDNFFVAKEFKTKHNLNFPILVDHTAATARAYDAVLENFAGMDGYTAANRTVYVIDGSGTIRYVWRGENPGIEPDYDAVKAAVKAVG